MASLKIQIPGNGVQLHPICKKLTSIGSSPDCDISHSDAQLLANHAHIHCDGRDFHLATLDRKAEIFVGGKKKNRHRLSHGDRFRIGMLELEFSLLEHAPHGDGEASALALVQSYKRLFEFSQQLMGNYEVPALLDSLLDVVIQVSNADKGFIVLLESGTPVVKVARNLRRETISDAIQQMSDSILNQVIETCRPLIISDALHDAAFNTAASVINLKLSSVMCVPLIERGAAIGAIYVGNDNVARLFDHSHLEILTVFAAQASLIVRNAILVNDLTLDNRTLQERIERMRFGELVGASPVMQEVFRKVQKVAATDISVLITGETGTGKELIAREIHSRSPRAKGPFVTINCGAIPETLLESELFGYVRGAFTGAVASKLGHFQSANKGTLFLDEIAEMPPPLQVKILRALQEHTVVRVGDTRAEPVDIRVVAATNRNLEDEIKAGRFREDLYYRLNVVNLHLPPLRERGDDIVVLARYFLSRQIAEQRSPARDFSPAALSALKRHTWPGNIRELDNRVKKAVVLAEKSVLTPEDLGLGGENLPPILPLAEAREKFQREYINEILALNHGNRTQTARDLGVDPRTIFRHLEKEEGALDAGTTGLEP